ERDGCIDLRADLADRDGRRTGAQGVNLRTALARELRDPTEIDPRIGRRAECKAAALRGIKESWRAGCAVDGREVGTQAIRGRSDRRDCCQSRAHNSPAS